MLLKSRASPDMLSFSLCNKKRLAVRHMNRLLFPTTLSIPSYDIGKQVGLRTYQQPLVIKYKKMTCLNKCPLVRLRAQLTDHVWKDIKMTEGKYEHRYRTRSYKRTQEISHVFLIR